MKLNTNAGPRTNRNILRRGGTIPDPWRTILYRRYTSLGGRGYELRAHVDLHATEIATTKTNTSIKQ